MTEDREKSQGSGESSLDRDFAEILGSILESAAGMFPNTENVDVRLSVALVGKMHRREIPNLVKQLPVVADIALNEDLGERAAILTDVPTASALASFVSHGELIEKDALSDDDILSLLEILNPILDAFSSLCEEATGRPFGSLENLFVSDPVSQERMAGQFTESLCRATASLSIGEVMGRRMVFVLPFNLAEVLTETRTISSPARVHPYEHIELTKEESKSAYSGAEAAREPSMENIDLILDIQLKLTARMGQVEMPIGEILKLAPGSVIDIDRFADEPIELVVNDRLIARGEIVVVQENFGIKITEIISPKERIESLRK